jgi:kynurenine formamidase
VTGFSLSPTQSYEGGGDSHPPPIADRIVSLSRVTDLLAQLPGARLVDLTQPLGPATVLWPGSRPFRATVAGDYASDGCYFRDLDVPEHAGTHFDAPAHFAPGGARVDGVPVEALVRPLVKLDVRPWVDGDPSVAVGADAVLELERRDGLIQRGDAVLVHTGWDAYADDPARYLGDPMSFPGLAGDAAALLVERGVVGIGIDTLSVDQGASTDLPVHTTTLPAGVWHLEGLVGLAAVPARGAWLVAAPIRLVDGSGAPARVVAIVPSDG